MRVVAVDWGERRIGLAVSDPGGVIATGLPTLVVRGVEDGLAQTARAILAAEGTRVVVGLPLLMSGEKGEAALAAETFAARLAERTGLPVETFDERLTSALSSRRLRETGVRTGHARARVDQGAAIALLESFLARLAARREAP